MRPGIDMQPAKAPLPVCIMAAVSVPPAVIISFWYFTPAASAAFFMWSMAIGLHMTLWSLILMVGPCPSLTGISMSEQMSSPL